VMETRTWNEAQAKTSSMRSKEEAMDYRYFPDPDLPVLQVSDDALEAARRTLPELPDRKRLRYVAELGLTPADAGVLTAHPAIAAFFEASAAALAERSKGALDLAAAGKKTANFVQSELLRHAKTDGLTAELGVSPAQLAELLALVESAAISGKQAKALLPSLLGTDRRPEELVREQGLAQVSDASAMLVARSAMRSRCRVAEMVLMAGSMSLASLRMTSCIASYIMRWIRSTSSSMAQTDRASVALRSTSALRLSRTICWTTSTRRGKSSGSGIGSSLESTWVRSAMDTA